MGKHKDYAMCSGYCPHVTLRIETLEVGKELKRVMSASCTLPRKPIHLRKGLFKCMFPERR